jgi:hypothetical protein
MKSCILHIASHRASTWRLLLRRGFGTTCGLRVCGFSGGQELVENLVHAVLPAQVFGSGVAQCLLDSCFWRFPASDGRASLLP